MSKDIGPPKNPKMAREEIERTRQRMSETLDQIEDVLVNKKEEFEEKKADLRRKLDIPAQVRSEPLAAAGIVVGVGFLIGFLTGGGGRKKVRSARRRSRKWEKRARRLLEIARSQEDEIAALQNEGAGIAGVYIHEADPDFEEDPDLYDEDDDDDDDDDVYLMTDRDYLYEDALTGEELYPLDPDLDDETIEYPTDSARRGPSLRDRLGAFAADAVESLLDAVPSRR